MPSSPADTTIVDRLRQRSADGSGQSFSFDDDGEVRVLLHTTLDQRARAIAAALQHLPAGRQVILLYAPGLDFIEAFFGTLYAGLVATPVYPPDPTRLSRTLPRLAAIIHDASPVAVLTTAALRDMAEMLDGLSEVRPGFNLRDLCWIPTDTLPDTGADAWIPPALGPDTLALIQYTSGSTDTPRGVMLTHGNLAANLDSVARAAGLDPSSRAVCWLPPYHDMGLIGGILSPVWSGFPMHLMSPMQFLRRPLVWLDAMSTLQANTTLAPNFAYDLCVRKISAAERATLDLRPWRHAMNGAEPIAQATIDRFTETFGPRGFRREVFFPAYGLAEAAVILSGGWLGPTRCFSRSGLEQQRAEPVDAGEHSRALVPSGRAVPGVQLHIVDPDTHTRLPPGHIGEIWASGPNIARGYLRRDEETARVFGARLQDEPERGPFLRTGDLGFFDQDDLFVTGRIRDLIVVRGRNHLPDDLERTAAASHPAIRAGCCAAVSVTPASFGVGDVLDETEGVGLICEVAEADLDEEGAKHAVIEALCREIVAGHGLVPAVVVLVAPRVLPKTSSGKIQRRAAAKLLEAGAEGQLFRFVRPRPRAEPVSAEPVLAEPVLLESLSAEPVLAEPVPLESLSAEPEPKTRALLDWLRGYAETRINSRIIDERRSIPPHIVLDFGNQGVMGLMVPTADGGLGLSHQDAARVFEQLAAIDVTLATFVGVHQALGTRPIQLFGGPSVRARHLGALARGRELGAFGLTEPGAGSNPLAIAGVARPGPRGLCLSAEKVWIGSASWAGVLNVFVQLLDEQGRRRGITGYVVRPDMPGFRSGPEALTMGVRGMVQNRVILDGVWVTPDDQLGAAGAGLLVAQDAMMHARFGIAAICVGAMKRATQLMIRYASRRPVSTGLLLDNAVTQERIDDSFAAIRCTEALVAAVARRLDAGLPVPVEAYIACKGLGPELLGEVADRLVQLLGGRGYIETNVAPQLLRDARLLRVFEGATETVMSFLGGRVLLGGGGAREILSGGWTARRSGDSRGLAVRLDEVVGRLRSRAGAAIDARDQLGLGEITTLLLTMAALDPCLGDDRHAAAWLERRLERRVDQLLGPRPSLPASADLLARAAGLARAIGDLEQQLPGEEQELDPLLRREPGSTVGPDLPGSTRPGSTPAIPSQPEERAPAAETGPPRPEVALPGAPLLAARELLARISGLPLAEIVADRPPALLPIDSLSAVEAVSGLGVLLGREIRLDAWGRASSLRALVEGVERPPPSYEADLAWVVPPIRPRRRGSVILVTGGTGMVGAAVVALLRRRGLVAPDDGVDHEEKQGQRRLVVLTRGTGADVTRPRLGLSPDAYAALVAEVDVVVHIAGAVNWVLPYSSLAPTNVSGTTAVITLCAEAGARLVLVSSQIVAHDGRGALAEGRRRVVSDTDPVEDLAEALPYLPIGYAQSKAVAELHVRRAAAAGLDATVLRPALVLGGQDGVVSPDDVVGLLLSTCVAAGVSPNVDLPFAVVDRSVLAEEIVAVLDAGPALRHVGDTSRGAREVIGWLTLSGYELPLVPWPAWLDRVEQLGLSRQGGLRGLWPFLQGGAVLRYDRALNPQLPHRPSDTAPVDPFWIEQQLEAWRSVGMIVAPRRRGARATQQSRALPPLPERVMVGGELRRVVGGSVAPAWGGSGLLSRLAAGFGDRPVGVYPAVLELEHGERHEVVLKASATGDELVALCVGVARASNPGLAEVLERHGAWLDVVGASRRERVLYGMDHPAFVVVRPRCFSAEVARSADGGGAPGPALVLERLRVGVEVDQLDAVDAPWPLPAVTRAVADLAAFHAAFLGRTSSVVAPWARVGATPGLLEPLWRALFEHARGRLPNEVVTLGAARLDRLDWAERLLRAPQTLLHNDTNPRNLSLRRGGGLVLYDWELAALGPPARDLAEFLCFVLAPDTPDAVVAALVRQHGARVSPEVSAPALYQTFADALSWVFLDRLTSYTVVSPVFELPWLTRVMTTWARLAQSLERIEARDVAPAPRL